MTPSAASCRRFRNVDFPETFVASVHCHGRVETDVWELYLYSIPFGPLEVYIMFDLSSTPVYKPECVVLPFFYWGARYVYVKKSTMDQSPVAFYYFLRFRMPSSRLGFVGAPRVVQDWERQRVAEYTV